MPIKSYRTPRFYGFASVVRVQYDCLFLRFIFFSILKPSRTDNLQQTRIFFSSSYSAYWITLALHNVICVQYRAVKTASHIPSNECSVPFVVWSKQNEINEKLAARGAVFVYSQNQTVEKCFFEKSSYHAFVTRAKKDKQRRYGPVKTAELKL